MPSRPPPCAASRPLPAPRPAAVLFFVACEGPNAIEIYECIINGLKLEAEAEVGAREGGQLAMRRHGCALLLLAASYGRPPLR